MKTYIYCKKYNITKYRAERSYLYELGAQKIQYKLKNSLEFKNER